MIKLDDRTVKANIMQLEAELSKAQAQLDYLDREYNRLLPIYKSGFNSKKDIDNAKSSLDAQAATVEATKASLENAKITLDYTVIRAPIAGRIGIAKLTVGNNVKGTDSQPIVTINQVDPAKVEFSLGQKYYRDIKVAIQKGDMNISVETPESKEILTGKLHSIDNTFDQNDNFSVEGIIDNADEKLWPGMFVMVKINLGTSNDVIAVPSSAIQIGQDKSYVYVVESGVAKKKNVQVKRTEDEMTVIEGVQAGELLITDGFLKIKDGSRVEVLVR